MQKRSWIVAGLAMLAGAAFADPPPYVVQGRMYEQTGDQTTHEVLVDGLGSPDYVGSSFVDLAVSSSGIPSVGADAALPGPDSLAPANALGGAQVQLAYAIEIVGPDGPVSIHVSAEGHVQFDADPFSVASATATFSLVDIAGGTVVWQDGAFVQATGVGQHGTDAFSVSQTFALLANHPYAIGLLAGAIVKAIEFNGVATASASADPTFTFAEGVDASLYTLVFSQGIGNGNVVVAVPEPAEVLLMLSGLAAIVAFVRRPAARRAAPGRARSIRRAP